MVRVYVIALPSRAAEQVTGAVSGTAVYGRGCASCALGASPRGGIKSMNPGDENMKLDGLVLEANIGLAL